MCSGGSGRGNQRKRGSGQGWVVLFFFFLLNFCNHGVAVFPAISRGGGFLFPFPFRGVAVGGLGSQHMELRVQLKAAPSIL